jgi:ketosteroid isomerase-like protein
MASGFTGATTAAIARNAEVTEAQLFRYFSSKIELFHESVFKPLNQHFLDFTSSQRSDDSPAETRRDKSHRNINELQEFLNLHSKSLMSLAVAQTYLPGSMNGIHDIDSLNTYFERGATMMASRILGIPKVDPTLMVRVSFAAVLGSILFKDWIFPQGLASDPEISAAIKAFVMDGINANAASECQPSKAITAGRSMSNANHQLARSFFDALSKGDVPDDLLTPDMTFWSTSSGAWSDRARFQYGIKLLASIFSGGLTYVVDSLTAEEDRVAAEVQSCGTLINGKEYQGRYVFVLRLRDQRIASVAEHNDPGSVRGRLGALLQTAIEKKQ